MLIHIPDRPTKQGIKVIDEAHDCYAMKFLKDKPVRTIEDDQWIRLTLVKESNLFLCRIQPDVR